jgi:hypothetical protein
LRNEKNEKKRGKASDIHSLRIFLGNSDSEKKKHDVEIGNRSVKNIEGLPSPPSTNNP